MKSLFTGKESQSTQVAKYLEGEIVSGKLKPDTKLKSTRELGKTLQVGKKVIISALDILEKKQLVVRHQRQGIYINSKALAPQKNDIYILEMGSPEKSSSYLEKVIFLNSGAFAGRSNLLHRKISRKDLTPEIFSYEIERIKSMHFDLIAITSSSMTRSELKKCLEIPIPVLFLGDFTDNTIAEGLEINQIMEDNSERADYVISYLSEQGYRNINIFTWGEDNSFVQEYDCTARNIAEKQGLNLNITNLNSSLNKTHDTEGAIIVWDDAAERMMKTSPSPDVMVFEAVSEFSIIASAFEKKGMKLPEDIDIVVREKLLPGCMCLIPDYTCFSDSVFKRIDNIIKNPGEKRRLKLSGKVDWEIIKTERANEG